MIAIINVGKIKNRKKWKYRVQINNKLVTTFYHNREDRLSVCLEKAAKAVREKESNEIIAFCQMKGEK